MKNILQHGHCTVLNQHHVACVPAVKATLLLGYFYFSLSKGQTTSSLWITLLWENVTTGLLFSPLGFRFYSILLSSSLI